MTVTNGKQCHILINRLKFTIHRICWIHSNRRVSRMVLLRALYNLWPPFGECSPLVNDCRMPYLGSWTKMLTKTQFRIISHLYYVRIKWCTNIIFKKFEFVYRNTAISNMLCAKYSFNNEKHLDVIGLIWKLIGYFCQCIWSDSRIWENDLRIKLM